MAAVMLLAFALRVVNLENQNIWGDEAFSIAFSQRALADVLSPDSETHPPLYHVLLHFWILIAGESALAVRYLSTMAGIVLIALIYATGKFLYRRRTAVVAAGLAALSAFAIYYSQETRMYAPVATMSLLAVYAMLRLARFGRVLSRTSAGWASAYFVATIAAIYTHYFAFLVLLAQNLFMLWRNRRDPTWMRHWVALHIALALSYVPWVVTHAGFLQDQAAMRFSVLDPRDLIDMWTQTLWGFGAGRTLPANYTWLAVILLGFVCYGMLRSWQSGGLSRFVGLYLLVPFAGAALIVPFMPFYDQRFLIVALPAYLLLLARGLSASNPALMLSGLALAAIGNGVALRNYHSNPAYAKGGYGDLMAYVQAHARPGDVLLLEDGAQGALYDYYGPPDIPAHYFPLDNPWDTAQAEPVLEELAAQHPRFWLVMFGNPLGYDAGRELERWLGKHASKAFHGDFVDASLDLFVQGEVLVTTPVDARFADAIALTGFGLSGEFAPGATLHVTLEWQALQSIGRDFTIFTHVVDDAQHVWAQVDSQPLGGAHPTSAWQPGEVVVDRFALQLDPAIPPGEYQVQAGWYDLQTLQRLPAAGSDARVLPDRVLLGPITVR